MPRRRITSAGFARSDAGVGYFDFLTTIGMTPPEFGALDDDIRRFYMVAWNEKQQRLDDEHDELEDSIT